jgi:hypothetical protein
MSLLECMGFPSFYLLPDGTEVVYEELVCPTCGTKADDMDDEADTQLICRCNQKFLHIIWDIDGLIKRHPDVFQKYGIE